MSQAALKIEPRVTFRAARAEERRVRRARANERASTFVSKEMRDPLLRSRDDRRPLVLAAYAVASLVFHVALFAIGALVPLSRGAGGPKTNEVRVEIVEPQKAAAPPPAPPDVHPTEPKTKPTPLPPAARPATTEPHKDDSPPPDPINIDTPPPPDPVKEPRRRIVGLNMESTTTGGTGGAYATGDTRMGQTANVGESPGGDRGGATFTAPKRTSAPKPTYPPALRATSIEGDVGLRVEIDAAGNVANVSVIEPSGHDEFNRAAVDAAQRSTYEPARANGVAVARAIEFTVRFRLRD